MHEEDLSSKAFHRSILDLEMITSYFYDGPQAVTYQIICNLLASKDKKEQEEGSFLLDYFVKNFIPDDTYSNEMSRGIWDATCRKLAYLNTIKVNNAMMDKYVGKYRFIFLSSFFNNGTEPSLAFCSNKCLQETKALKDKAEPLFNNIVNICRNKAIKAAERERVLMGILGVLSNSFGGNNQYATNPSVKQNSNQTTTQPYVIGERMIDKTHVSDEIVGAAIMAGWTPESTSNSSSSSTKSSSSSTPGRICHACYGNKKHQACNGTGTQLAFGNKRTEKCSGCHGTGKCPNCNGNGYH